MNNKDFYRIGRVRISATNQQDTQKKLTENAINGNGGYVCVSNMRMVRYANIKL